MPGKEKAPASSGNVIDLVALLQQSLGKKPAGKTRTAKAKTPARRKSA